jgi:hypothetical protein
MKGGSSFAFEIYLISAMVEQKPDDLDVTFPRGRLERNANCFQVSRTFFPRR